MEDAAEEKLERFRQWLQVNAVEMRGCEIKHCGPGKGFGVFSSSQRDGRGASESDGILLVVPLDLAITPMRVLQDPLIGPECRAMFEQGEVDDRFLMILFLMLQRLRKNSCWKPYLDMLPTNFGNPLWFTDDELSELRGTTLHRATELQKKSLLSLYNDKVKGLVNKLLITDGDSESEFSFEDFLWANSVFWTRALNIPLPRAYVFPQVQEDEGRQCSLDDNCETVAAGFINGEDTKGPKFVGDDPQVNGVTSTSIQGETVWVEGLVPGIDFCNHDVKSVATWEVDGIGEVTGVPFSMYLLSAERNPLLIGKEITISYGNKGNEELLYLYGFVIDENPDDYLMVHYPAEAIRNVSFSDSKMQLLEAQLLSSQEHHISLCFVSPVYDEFGKWIKLFPLAQQKAEMRCLLPKRLLDHGFFPSGPSKNGEGKCEAAKLCTFSWSGERRMPSYANKLVFPEDFLTTLRTIAMQEDELYKVSSLLEELVGSEEERQPTDAEVRAAVWEVCGDSGAFQLLVDLLNMRMMDLEDGTGTEHQDSELLEKAWEAHLVEHQTSEGASGFTDLKPLSRNRWASIVYRRGQKELTRLFLREAEHALQLSLIGGD